MKIAQWKRGLTAAALVAVAALTLHADEKPSSTVLLGSAELTAGIPGKGPLTTEQIKRWLANPANHQPLEVELPLGLDAGRSAIVIPKDGGHA
jgi:cytochrome c peroxidase